MLRTMPLCNANEPSLGMAHGVHQRGSWPWGVSTLSSFSAQADDGICPLGIGHVPDTFLDLQRECRVTEKHRYWDHNDLFDAWPYQVLAAVTLSKFLNALRLSFLTWKIKTIIVPCLLGYGGIKVHNTHKTSNTVISSPEDLNKHGSHPFPGNWEHRRPSAVFVDGSEWLRTPCWPQ